MAKSASEEIIVKVLDHVLDSHTRSTQYLLEAVVPSQFNWIYNNGMGRTLWCDAKYLPKMTELEPSHAASILYGTKRTR